MTTTDSGSVFPLTTVWSPPTSCPSIWGYIGSDCEPPHYSAVFATEYGYYSPGICFDGYTSGCDMTWRSVERGETAVICVPSGWDCSGQIYATSYYGDGYTSTVPAFEIRWVEDDLSLFETNPLRPGETVATMTSPAVTRTVSMVPGYWPPTTEATSTPSDDVEKDVDEADDWGDEKDASGGGGVPTGTVAGVAVGVALFVAILCGAAFIWYRKRRVGSAKAATEGPPDCGKTNDSSVPLGASQEMLGHYQTPGPMMVTYPNTMYTQPTQMMPLYQFPPGTPPLLAQPYGPPPGVSHELAGAYVQAQADISELHAESQTPTPESPKAEAATGAQRGNAQTVDPTKDVKPTQSHPVGEVEKK